MSTPTGKPFNPFDLSPYAPKRARDRTEQERADDAGDGESAVLLPYARKSNLRQVPPQDDLPRAVAPAQEPLIEPRESERPAESPTKAEVAPEQDLMAEGTGAGESISDADLQRLESSLRWLQREGSGSGRLPRAVQLPPVAGIPAVDPDGARPRGDQFINGYRVPPSLAPERLRPPPPMRERGDSLRGPLRIVLASVLAAPIAYYFSVGGLSRWTASAPPPEPQLAAAEQRPVAPTTMQVPKDPVRAGDTQSKPVVVQTIRQTNPDSDPASVGNQAGPQPTTQSTQPSTSQAASQPTTVAVTPPVEQPANPTTNTMVASNAPTAATGGNALPQPGLPVTAAPRAVKTVRQLDPEAVKLLMKQGEQFVAAGDVVTARLVFQRAAEAGDATAALAMGATYDPIVLAKLGARGIVADVDKARGWYEKAKEFGSPEAPKRIEMLANR